MGDVRGEGEGEEEGVGEWKGKNGWNGVGWDEIGSHEHGFV